LCTVNTDFYSTLVSRLFRDITAFLCDDVKVFIETKTSYLFASSPKLAVHTNKTARRPIENGQPSGRHCQHYINVHIYITATATMVSGAQPASFIFIHWPHISTTLSGTHNGTAAWEAARSNCSRNEAYTIATFQSIKPMPKSTICRELLAPNQPSLSAIYHVKMITEERKAHYNSAMKITNAQYNSYQSQNGFVRYTAQEFLLHLATTHQLLGDSSATP
jgi:hypothetical protein